MKQLARWIDRAASGVTLIATDFGGTLVDVTTRPDDAWLSDRARATLSRLVSAPHTHVAILSGRTLSDLAPRVAGIGPLWLSSDHGAVVIDPLRRAHRLESRTPGPRIADLRARAQHLARVFRGAHLEVKPWGVAVHYRDVPEQDHNSLMELFRMSCIAHGARFSRGRRVIEGRFDVGDKGNALAYIVSKLPAHVSSLIYVGDDVNDEPAFAYAHRHPHGLALHVASDERIAPRAHVHGSLRGPSEWIEILDELERKRRRMVGRE